MMTIDEVMAALEGFGTAQNRKIYRRHGATDPLFGVSYANLKLLVKQLKRNQALAEALWATRNHDARMLAGLIADPKTVTRATLEAWASDLRNYAEADALTSVAIKTPYAQALAEQWNGDEDEWRATVGWSLLANLADASALPDSYFSPYLAQIEQAIHQRKNRVRYAMNQALIGVGLRDGLEGEALRVAGAIGVVQVDHGETGCKTPDAASYIAKTRQHRLKKQQA